MGMTVDKAYCASSFLTLRTIADPERTFQQGVVPRLFRCTWERTPVSDSIQLEALLRAQVAKATQTGKAALALSGGIDSAILAKFMPKGSVAYTFKCVVPGMQVTDESPAAARYARECGLEHRVVEIFWEDFEQYAPRLMLRKGLPIHSIEVQIYKAALQARADGFDTLIFGESADVNFGGHDGLLSKDWRVWEFMERYSYVMPHRALRDARIISAPFARYEKDGGFDTHEFIRQEYFNESMGTYTNACQSAEIAFEAPYAHAFLGTALDYDKVRSGQSKYLVRQVFRRLYPDFEIPVKVPMPRPMNEWMRNWSGPVREEFWPCCTENMTGDQKWLVWALERFLNLLDEKER